MSLSKETHPHRRMAHQKAYIRLACSLNNSTNYKDMILESNTDILVSLEKYRKTHHKNTKSALSFTSRQVNRNRPLYSITKRRQWDEKIPNLHHTKRGKSFKPKHISDSRIFIGRTRSAFGNSVTKNVTHKSDKKSGCNRQ